MRVLRRFAIGAGLLATASSLFAQTFPFPRSGDERFAYAASRKPFDRAEPPLTQAQLDASVVAAYELWRAKFLQRITHAVAQEILEGKEQAFVNVSAGDPEAKGDERFRSVSEGHGYGMLIAALMAGHPNRPPGTAADREKKDFDALYRFFRAHPSVPDAEGAPTVKHANLMAFQVQGRDLAALVKRPPDEESDSASDGDMDIAYALLLAERQWGNDGEIDYGAAAKAVLGEIETYDLNAVAATVKLGDAVTAEYEDAKEKAENKFFAVRTSDFMPQHWRTFAKVGRRELWERVIAQSLAIEASVFAKYAPKTGLMPDFLQLPLGKGNAPSMYRPPTGFFQEDKENNGDGNWSYNACRTPWRLATDYLVNGDKSALPQLRALNAWSAAQMTKGAAVKPSFLNAGYTLKGDKLSVKEGKRTHFEPAGACFLAPLAVSATIEGSTLDPLWARLTEKAIVVDDEGYFDSTVKLLCLITISGNWWDPKSDKLP